MKRILIYTGAGLLLLLLLLAGGLWIFRNRILNQMAERKRGEGYIIDTSVGHV